MIKRILTWCAILGIGSSLAMDLQMELDLSGNWKFEIGDNTEYSKENFDDKNWEIIRVPNAWENEGFPGYDGYAWYRLTFHLPKKLSDKMLYLKLGRIDDVDRVFINGHFVNGKGQFPPKYDTAYDMKRVYPLSNEHLKFNHDNTIAIRVYDLHGQGGITDGDIGIFSRMDVIDLKIDLSGKWRFSTGDDLKWADPKFNDSRWNRIEVPSFWEKQGYTNHDGFAWYRESVFLSKSLAQVKLILLLGKINDADEVYFNGALIGGTGKFPENKGRLLHQELYKEERAYFIPPYLIKTDKPNVIAVRVYDAGSNGGIAKGDIGITSRREYMKYIKRKNK